MIEVLKQAIEALERSVATCFDQYAHQQVMSQPDHFINQAITSLRQAISELESQEPVAYINVEKRILQWAKLTSWETPTVVNLPKIPLYIHPPQRTWVGLTGEMLLKAAQSSLAPEQYDHFEAMSKHQPDIYDRLAYAIRVQDE